MDPRHPAHLPAGEMVDAQLNHDRQNNVFSLDEFHWCEKPMERKIIKNNFKIHSLTYY